MKCQQAKLFGEDAGDGYSQQLEQLFPEDAVHGWVWLLSTAWCHAPILQNKGRNIIITLLKCAIHYSPRSQALIQLFVACSTSASKMRDWEMRLD